MFEFIGACGGEPTEQSSESFSAMADVHNDPSVIESTAEIDRLLVEQDPTVTGRPVSSSLIRCCSIVPVVQVMIVPVMTVRTRQSLPCLQGKGHLITVIFMSTPNTRLMAMPWEHKRHRTMRIDLPKAKPLPIQGFDMQLSRPLDFYAVTDHAMFLGLVKASAETVTEFSQNDFASPYHGLNDEHNYGTDFASMMSRLGTFAGFCPVL